MVRCVRIGLLRDDLTRAGVQGIDPWLVSLGQVTAMCSGALAEQVMMAMIIMAYDSKDVILDTVSRSVYRLTDIVPGSG